jgi:tetratricopeptide (TPR) repeat protein
MVIERWVVIGILGFSLMLGGCQNKEARVSGYLASGNQYLAEENFSAAKIQFSNVIQLDPYNMPALEALGGLYEKDNQTSELYRTLQTILQVDGDNLEARLRLVKLLAYEGDLDKALAESDKILTMAPDMVDALVVRAGVLFRVGREAEAVAQSERVLNLDAGNTHASFMLAHSLSIQNQHPKAIELLNTALAQHPQEKLLYLLKIKVLNSAGRSDETISLFKTLLDREPADFALNQAFANQYVALGDAENAEKLLRDFADREKTPEAHLMLVRYLLEHKKAVNAEEQLNTYIQAFPLQSALQFALAELYLNSNRRETAKALLNKLAGLSKVSDQLLANNLLAKIAALDGDFSTETALYQQVLVADSRNVEAILGLARQSLRQKNFEKAINDLQSVLVFAADNPDLQLVLAQAYELDSQLSLAHDHFLKSVRQSGGAEKFVAEYARFLVKTGEWQAAEKVLDSYSGGHANDTWRLGLMAQVKLRLGKWEEAQSYAARLEQLGVDQTLISQLQGAAYTGMGKYEQSLVFFEKVALTNAGQFRPMASLVGAYLRAGKRSEAEGFLKNTLELQPENVFAQVLTGVLYEYHGELGSAEMAYRRALEMDPGFKEVYRRLLAILVKQDKLQEGVALLRRAQEQLAEPVGSLAVSEAVLLQQLGRMGEAKNIYRKIIQANPNADIAYNNLASLLLMGDDADKREARKMAERFRSSDVPHFQDTLGWIYLNTNNKIDGLYLLEKAAKVLKDNAEVRYHLGMAYLANERKIEARRELEYAVLHSGQTFVEFDLAKSALASLDER